MLTRVVSDRIGQFVLEIEPDALDALPMPEALERMLLAYGTLTLSDRTIAMHRLVIRECDQFPEVAAAFYEAAIRRANDAMARWLCRRCTLRRFARARNDHCEHGKYRQRRHQPASIACGLPPCFACPLRAFLPSRLPNFVSR